MKILNRSTPYSIKWALPILGMSVATLFGGCKKEGLVDTTPKFERTFVWGQGISSKDLAGVVAASADSVQVGKIILKSDGEDWGGTNNVSYIMSSKVQPLIDACGRNQHKIVHTGLIQRPAMRTDTPELYKTQQADSAKLVNLGYEIPKVLYRENGR